MVMRPTSGGRGPDALIIEDMPALARVYGEYLAKAGISSVLVETGREALESLGRTLPRIVILDMNLPDMSGMDILKFIKHEQLPTEVIVITAHGSVNTAVEAMQAGACDFVVKPFNADRLIVTARNALERWRLRTIVDALKEEGGEHRHGFIGSSLAMQAVYRIIDSAAASRATVFITGESGTGKEVCAEAIHRASPRRSKPLVAINCGAIPRDLIESEIFGHVKGAFTGALSERDGAATRADGGTLFLDELCEMDHNLQTKLLRFIQSGTFQRVGGSVMEKVDIRIVCATNRDPVREVEEGRFREDLYYRLHVIPIHLPPLREREDDVIEIARHLLAHFSREERRRFTGFNAAAEAVLKTYRWPGNVRQLQNVLRNVVVLRDGDLVTADMLPPPVGPGPAGPGTGQDGLAGPVPAAAVTTAADPATPEIGIRPLALVEKEAILRAIALCNGNIPRAAALLEVAPSTLYRKMQAWERH